MDHSEDQGRPRLFTVRLWIEQLGEGRSEWRGQVRDVASGETRYFHEWPALVDLLREMLAAHGGKRDSGS